MIQNNGDCHNCSHYYDSDGVVQDIEVGSTSEFNPETFEFHLKDGRITSLFVKNNPWRASLGVNTTVVYQFCVICKQKRFENKSFNGTDNDFKTVEHIILPGRGESFYTCRRQPTCSEDAWWDIADNLSEDSMRIIFGINMELLSKSKAIR
jgi:hypothetical protein